jgi:hypothetical protein
MELPDWVIRFIWSVIFGAISGSISALLMCGFFSYKMRKNKYINKIEKLEEIAFEIESLRERLDKIDIKQLKKELPIDQN